MININDKVILVSFFAKWCGYCKAQEPIIEEIRKSMGDKLEIYKLDIDDNGNKGWINELKIDATPTTFIMRDDKVFKKYVGLANKNELESAIMSAFRS